MARHIGVAAAAALALLAGIGPAMADTVVTAFDPAGWAFNNRDVNGVVGANSTGGGTFVFGPDAPPAGAGSANLFTGNGTSGGDGAGELRNTLYAGTRLDAITALGFSTYVTLNNGQQLPYFGLMINNSGASSGVDNILFFEAPYQQPTTGNPLLPDQGATAMNTWQAWDALVGGWWDNNGVLGYGGLGGVDTLTAYLVQFPDATIVNADGTGLGGVRFDVGFASDIDQFNGYVDKFTIGVSGDTTTYDFEVPEPASLTLLGFGIAGLGWVRRRRD